MKAYQVKVGSIPFGGGHYAASDTEMIKKIKEQIEQLHPINMSEENVEAYRNRFRGKEITIKYMFDRN